MADKIYQNVLELAYTGRYVEAKAELEKLLALEPGQARALALLGKIEFYLGHFRSSRKAFELSLSYDASDFASYLGIQYFKERKLKISIFIFFVSFILLLLIGNAVIINSYSSMNESKLANFKTDMSMQIVSLETEISSLIDSQGSKTLDTAQKLEELTGLVRKQADREQLVLKDILKRLDDLVNR
jgi:tetratricopeptide (TPR) repeat protein